MFIDVYGLSGKYERKKADPKLTVVMWYQIFDRKSVAPSSASAVTLWTR